MGSGTLTVRVKAIMPLWTNYSDAVHSYTDIYMKRIRQPSIYRASGRLACKRLENYSVYEELRGIAKPLYIQYMTLRIMQHVCKRK